MNYLSRFHTFLCTSLNTILDLLFPKSALVREIEQMSAAEFASRRRFNGHCPPEYADWSRTILAYRDRHVRAAVWELKYRKNVAVAKLFAEILADELGKLPGDIIIVPIPLSEKRRHERGYNQIELILEQLPKDARWTIAPELLRRKHHTIPQATLSRAERLKNLEGCFEVPSGSGRPGAAENVLDKTDKKVILVDDVMTTGSTLRQAREALLRAGAREVIAIALAH